MLRRSRPLLCSTATGTSFGAQQPTGRTAWVGCTASAKITASVVGLDEARLFHRVQLARDRGGFAVFHPQTVQQRDQTGSGLVFDAAFSCDPRTDRAGRAWQRLADAGLQPVLLRHRQPASAPFVAEARQTLDPVVLIQPVSEPDRVVVQ